MVYVRFRVGKFAISKRFGFLRSQEWIVSLVVSRWSLVVGHWSAVSCPTKWGHPIRLYAVCPLYHTVILRLSIGYLSVILRLGRHNKDVRSQTKFTIWSCTIYHLFVHLAILTLNLLKRFPKRSERANERL